MESAQFPIRIVVKRTDVAATTLRMWEQRHGAIRPDRDRNGRRLYREEDVARVEMLSALIDAGYRISDIADLPDSSLAELLESLTQREPPAAPSARSSGNDAGDTVEFLLDAAGRADLDRIETTLESAVAAYGTLGMIDSIVFPAIRDAHARYAAGETSRSGVSLLHATLVRFVTRLATGSVRVPGGEEGEVKTAPRPVVAVGVLETQTDLLGALAAIVHIRAAGWYPLLLGGGLTARSVVTAMEDSGASAALVTAAVYADDRDRSRPNRIRHALIEIGSTARSDRPVYFGGRVPRSVIQGLPEHGVRPLPSMGALRHELSAIGGGRWKARN